MGDDKPFWVRAREVTTVARGRKGQAQDCFAGRSAVFSTQLEGVAVVRLDVTPEPDGVVPTSYALAPAALAQVWRAQRGGRLPAGIRWRQEAESRFAIELSLGAQTRCLGLGELYRGLNRRGQTHTLFNSDDPHHLESTPRLYKAIPFLVLETQGKYTGLFLDSPAPQKWSLGKDLGDLARVELLTRRGFQLYHFGTSTLPELVRAYSALTGRSALPPRWSLGHQQCRWSYPTQARILEVAGEFRRRKIPCDTLVADIDYMDEYRVFSVSRERFPTFEQMTDELARDGFRLVTILDPGVKASPADATYRAGLAADVFVKTPSGEPYQCEVWAGPSHFPDFLRADVRAWWGERLRLFDRLGVAGIWNDMNEPAVFNVKTLFDTTADELPPTAAQPFVQEVPEGVVGHLEVHNLYGSQMARAAWEALSEHRPEERPFVLSRSAYAGHQRFGAVWLGDNASWFEHLRLSVPMLVSMGLSGVPFVGVDVGGFGHDADGELLVRWYQLGIFYPFFRNHCALGQHAQEPWAFGPEVEGYIRSLIAVRYRLLPYLEGLFHEHRATGAPLMRPLEWHAADDPTARGIDDQFFLGSDLLVAPIVSRGQTRRSVYLPAGKWHPFTGGRPLVGGRHHEVTYGFDSVPAFVRDGAILPLAAPVQHTGELAAADLTFRCFGKRARTVYREDDGQSLGYELGACDAWELAWNDGRFRAQALQLGYGGTARRYFVSDGVRRRRVELPR